MNNLNTATLRNRSFWPAPFLSSLTPTAGPASEQLRQASARNVFSSLSTPLGVAQAGLAVTRPADTLADRLDNALAACKMKTSTVAMHLDAVSRTRLFKQLDSLLNVESWDADDVAPSEQSFTTLLRMILFLGGRRPGLGATSTGNFIATWTEGTDRLTIECKPADHVRWVLVHDLDGERESAAGETTVPRLIEVLMPYDLSWRWFPHALEAAA